MNGEATAEKENKAAKKPKPKKTTTKKDAKAESSGATTPVAEESLDLASVVKRRRVLAAKMKAQKAEQEKLDRERLVLKA